MEKWNVAKRERESKKIEWISLTLSKGISMTLFSSVDDDTSSSMNLFSGIVGCEI